MIKGKKWKDIFIFYINNLQDWASIIMLRMKTQLLVEKAMVKLIILAEN